ncbi:MAG: radical SAM protein [bacterium]
MSKEKGKRPLRRIYLYITSGCNLRCRHCWVGSGPEKQAKRPELDLDSWKRIIDESIEIGLDNVKLTGGEPLLIRDTTYGLMLCLRERKIGVNMETNGTLLDDEVARFFAETKGSFISVSVDGPDGETHDAMRCVPGAFDMAVEGMRVLARHKVRFQLICAVHRGNVDCAEDMVRLGREVKAGSVRFLPVSRMGRGSEMVRRDEALNVQETIDFCRFVQEDLTPRAGINISIELTPAFCSWDYIMKCHRRGACGLPNMAGMLADGTFAMCGIAEHHENTIYGNAVETSIQELWRSAPSLLAQREAMDSGIKGYLQHLSLSWDLQRPLPCRFGGRLRAGRRAVSVLPGRV